MKDGNFKKTLFLAIMSVVLVAALVGVATFAWFTNNSKVETNTVTGRSASADAKLLIGPDEASLVDSSETDVEINQINEADKEKLIPVSTSDLNTFWYCPHTTGKEAQKFLKDEDEKYYFHGKMCLEMRGEQLEEGTKYNLYLDTNEMKGGPIVSEDTGHILSASRLGLKFGDNEPVIFKFDDGNAESGGNTVIGGQTYASGYVLDPGGSPVSDPAETTDIYSLDSSATRVEIPEKALVTLEANRPMEMDIYFYLEGCDENCINDIQTDDCNLHLAFYAVADTEG